jgi:murE/murF fusion protein
MAAAAEAHADLLVLTSDNPRSESPSAIIAQLRAGLRRAPHRVEEDRALAIAQTVQAADPADVVLIAGKGHEAYQEIGQERLPFSDLDQARLALQARTGSGDSAHAGDDRGAGFAGRTRYAMIPRGVTRVFELRQAFDWLPDAVLFGTGSEAVGAVSTDTRMLKAGDLFVALRGESFDAHDFVGAALDGGAAAVVVERWTERTKPPALLVPDSRKALGWIAAGWRNRFDLPVIAVTGSNGKTTVKEMIASILAAHVGRAAAFATRGNLNNDVGVPLTLLSLRARTGRQWWRWA